MELEISWPWQAIDRTDIPFSEIRTARFAALRMQEIRDKSMSAKVEDQSTA